MGPDGTICRASLLCLRQDLATLKRLRLAEGLSPRWRRAVEEEIFRLQTLLSYAANPEVFTNRIVFTSTRTGRSYVVFQRSDIDWNLVRTNTDGPARFLGRTNAEAARAGFRPELSDGNFVTLHHSQQQSIGPWFEASTRYHNLARAQEGPLHPFEGEQHPHFPLGRGRGSLRQQFQRQESPEYWIWREANR
jgi:hypothetical protein